MEFNAITKLLFYYFLYIYMYIIIKYKMFINRKTRKLSKLSPNKIINESQSIQQHNSFSQHSLHTQIISYPILQYIFGFSLVAFSIYLLYSAGGGTKGIKGFNQKLWWQIIVGIGFIIFCQIQSLQFSRKNNIILITKVRFFCFKMQEIKKEFSDLIGISVIKTGKDMVNITMTNYHIVLSFKTCDEVSTLRCISQGKILQYFEEIRRIFSNEEISQNKVAIQNLL